MVSSLPQVVPNGDLTSVLDILKDPSIVDIDINDQSGPIPLLDAVKNGHIEIVRALLDNGADVSAITAQARLEDLNSDPAMLQLLNSALHRKPTLNGPIIRDPAYPSDHNVDHTKGWNGSGAHPPYAYYLPVPQSAIAYYPASPPSAEHGSNMSGIPNLPPPEIARYIPCRYFPACRYGASCIFLHPQGPYFTGPLPPPAPYPAPYDPNSLAQHSYPTNYYTPSFSSVNGIPPQINPISPSSGPQPATSPTQSAMSPAFNGKSSSLPYGGPMSPSYPHPGSVPLALPHPQMTPLHHALPAMHHPPPSVPPGSHPSAPLYGNSQGSSASAPPYGVTQYSAPQCGMGTKGHAMQGSVSLVKSPQARAQGADPPLSSAPATPSHRDGPNGSGRRGNYRRGSFGRKPPCLFFPSGRCKNGDDCRFPHIPMEGGSHQNFQHSGRAGNRTRPNNHSSGAIEEKMAGMSVKESPQDNRQVNGTATSSRSQSTDAGGGGGGGGRLPKYGGGGGGYRGQNHHAGGAGGNGTGRGGEKRPLPLLAVKPQRVPGADEFPVLGGAFTPPVRSAGSHGSGGGGGGVAGGGGSHAHSLPNGHAGPTAAQVLVAPPPLRRDSARENGLPVVGGTDSGHSAKDRSKADTEVSGVSEVPHEAAAQIVTPVPFATIASPAPDMAKEVSVSA